MPHSPSTFAQLPDSGSGEAAAPAPTGSPWLRALRAVGVAALVIAALFVIAAFLLLPVVPA